MKYQVRRCEKYTAYLAAPVAHLDPEDFRNHENYPYEGNSEEDFLNYIKVFDLDDIDGLSDETIEEYANSAHKFCDQWFEIGEENEEYRKTGGFNARHYSDQ
jgi:antirestriction protein ArdC